MPVEWPSFQTTFRPQAPTSPALRMPSEVSLPGGGQGSRPACLAARHVAHGQLRRRSTRPMAPLSPSSKDNSNSIDSVLIVTSVTSGRRSVIEPGWDRPSALSEGQVVPHRLTDVDLTWPVDPGVLLKQFLVVGEPTSSAGYREEDREHVHREAHRLIDQA